MDYTSELEADIAENWTESITDESILRMKSQIRPLPLPPHMTPRGGAPLEDIDDETLMTAPPHVICHMQRTAAQGGLQIVSPRQVPFSYLMRRVSGARKELGDHIVGSVASEDISWPTLDGDDLDHWLPDEPLPPPGIERSHRAKTRAVSLTTTTHELTDPILGCLIKGRAVIDILRRDDVQGDADTFSELLARAWGVDKSDINDLDAYTLGVDGPLLRHAIKADEVYSTMYAPIHVRRCISVGCVEASREYLPDDSAMDWRRMRVFCEAVFALAVSIEGYPLAQMRAIPPPGDTGAAGDRPNVMCFQPSPAICWTFEGATFSLFPLQPEESMKCSAIPKDVLEALSRYVTKVRPVSHMMATGHKPKAMRSTAGEVKIPVGETITSSYRMLVQTVTIGAARGRIAASTMRNVIYQAIEQAPLDIRLRLVRYIRIAREECKVHLSKEVVPDSMIVKLANRFLKVGSLIRVKVVAEATRRGATPSQWWSDLLSQAPDRYEEFVEGSKGWAVLGLWLLFRAPTDKWTKLSSAMNFSALRDAELAGLGSVRLPPKKGSPERLLEAARHTVKRISGAYAGYYSGVADVGLCLADVAEAEGKARSALVLKECAYLWMLRARCLRGTNVDLIAKDTPTQSQNHLRVTGPKVDLLVVPAPYRAYAAYATHVEQSKLLPVAYKAHIKAGGSPPLSRVFQTWKRPIYPLAKTTLSRYMNSAITLGNDMEAAWRELTGDVRHVMERFGGAESPPPEADLPPEPPAPQVIIGHVDLAPKKAPSSSEGVTFWEATGYLFEDQMEWVENLLEEMGPAVEGMFYERRYRDTDDLLQQLQDLEKEHRPQTTRERETVT